MKTPLVAAAFLAVVAFAACSDSPEGPTEIGPPASIALHTGTPSALANTDLAGLKVIVKDASGNAVPSQSVTFAVTAGGGSIQQTTATSGTDGTVKDAKILRGQALLNQAALDAVSQWAFTPTLLNGAPVEVMMTVTVNFQLQ